VTAGLGSISNSGASLAGVGDHATAQSSQRRSRTGPAPGRPTTVRSAGTASSPDGQADPDPQPETRPNPAPAARHKLPTLPSRTRYLSPRWRWWPAARPGVGGYMVGALDSLVVERRLERD